KISLLTEPDLCAMDTNKLIKHWTDTLSQCTEAYLQLAEALSIEELHQPPEAQAWSIAQILEHLIIINETYFPILEQLKAGSYRAYWTSRIPGFANWMGQMIHQSVLPETSRKTQTFPIWEPTQATQVPNIIERFKEHQEKMINAIHSSEYLLQKNPVVSSPANKVIVYRLAKAFEIIVSHEQRHLRQAQQLQAQLLAQREVV
ncbi:MAG: DinB family protein, partial [Bacteroidota bacterium]